MRSCRSQSAKVIPTFLRKKAEKYLLSMAATRAAFSDKGLALDISHPRFNRFVVLFGFSKRSLSNHRANVSGKIKESSNLIGLRYLVGSMVKGRFAEDERNDIKSVRNYTLEVKTKTEQAEMQCWKGSALRVTH